MACPLLKAIAALGPGLMTETGSLLFAFLTAIAVATSATAQVAAVANGGRPAAPSADAIRYRVVVDGPDPVARALRAGLDLIRWQVDEEMTLDLLQRLVREAVPQAREIAAIQGFYNAEIGANIERDGEPYVVRIKVEPGSAVRVTSVDIDVTGPAAGSARGMRAAGPPQGSRPPGGAARSDVRGGHMNATGRSS